MLQSALGWLPAGASLEHDRGPRVSAGRETELTGCLLKSNYI